jgi:hypothetical protein
MCILKLWSHPIAPIGNLNSASGISLVSVNCPTRVTMLTRNDAASIVFHYRICLHLRRTIRCDAWLKKKNENNIGTGPCISLMCGDATA